MATPERKTLSIKSSKHFTLYKPPSIKEEFQRKLRDSIVQVLNSQHAPPSSINTFREQDDRMRQHREIKSKIFACIQPLYEEFNKSLPFPSQSRTQFKEIVDNVHQDLVAMGEMNASNFLKVANNVLYPKDTLPRVPLNSFKLL